MQCSQTQPITPFEPRINDAPSEATSTGVSVHKYVNKKLGSNLGSFSLGRAAVRGRQFLIGTDDMEAAQNYVMLLDRDIMDNIRADPILAIVQATEHIRDIRWVSPSLAVASVGKGLIQLFNINATPGNASIQPTGTPVTNIHNDYVRELAPHPLMGNIIASVGRRYDVYQ